ncbi:hypothetical protein PsYK624_052290 [Phanerochaete sordida]|uniref:Uncharacterized protein n=1 Tax=Phanerochaete sordida TaxID=48140 RepID=A0A9P3G7B6_9APHY|nr:hypothetical protein PsYK624_052290 [Phanerochaete sordida]
MVCRGDDGRGCARRIFRSAGAQSLCRTTAREASFEDLCLYTTYNTYFTAVFPLTFDPQCLGYGWQVRRPHSTCLLILTLCLLQSRTYSCRAYLVHEHAGQNSLTHSGLSWFRRTRTPQAESQRTKANPRGSIGCIQTRANSVLRSSPSSSSTSWGLSTLCSYKTRV